MSTLGANTGAQAPWRKSPGGEHLGSKQLKGQAPGDQATGEGAPGGEHLGAEHLGGAPGDQAPGCGRDLTMPQHSEMLGGVVKRQIKHTASLIPFLERTDPRETCVVKKSDNYRSRKKQ